MSDPPLRRSKRTNLGQRNQPRLGEEEEITQPPQVNPQEIAMDEINESDPGQDQTLAGAEQQPNVNPTLL